MAGTEGTAMERSAQIQGLLAVEEQIRRWTGGGQDGGAGERKALTDQVQVQGEQRSKLDWGSGLMCCV